MRAAGGENEEEGKKKIGVVFLFSPLTIIYKELVQSFSRNGRECASTVLAGVLHRASRSDGGRNVCRLSFYSHIMYTSTIHIKPCVFNGQNVLLFFQLKTISMRNDGILTSPVLARMNWSS